MHPLLFFLVATLASNISPPQNATEVVPQKEGGKKGGSRRGGGRAADQEIGELVKQISRMKEVGDKLSSVIFDLASEIASADVHVNVSSALWNIDKNQDKRAALIRKLDSSLRNHSAHGVWNILGFGYRGERHNTLDKQWHSGFRRILEEQDNDLDQLKAIVRKLHYASLKHGSFMQKIRRSLIQLLQTLETAHNLLNSTHLKVKGLESLKAKVKQQIRLKNYLNQAKIDYETGMVLTNNGSAQISLQKISKISDPNIKHQVRHLADPALLHVEVSLLFSLLALIGAAAIGGLVAERGGLPATFGYIAGGMVCGPSGLNLVTELQTVQTLAQIGSIFVFFQHGIRFRKGVSRRGKNNVSAYGILRILSMTTVNMGLSCVLAGGIMMLTRITTGFKEGISIALAVGSSSLSMAATRLQSNIPLRSPHLFRQPEELLTAMAVTSDGFLSLLMSFPNKLVEDKNSLFQAALTSAIGLAVILTIVIVTERVLSLVSDNTSQVRSRGVILKSSDLLLLKIACALLSSIVTKIALGLSFEIGAFFSGLLFARIDDTHIGSVLSIFGGILFASMGTIINFRFIIQNSVLLITTALIIYIIKLTSAMVTLSAFDVTNRRSLWFYRSISINLAKLGVSLTGIGELSLVFVAQAHSAGLVSRRNYLLFLVVTVISGVCFPSVQPIVLRIFRSGIIRGLNSRKSRSTPRSPAADQDRRSNLGPKADIQLTVREEKSI